MAVLRNALNGIAHAWRTQRNLRIQSVIAILALIVFAVLHAPAATFAIVALTIAVVLAFEVMNTALEALVDLVSPQRQPLARAAKDAAAGAVLITALGALVAGIVLAVALLPR
ncbi:MAG: diacylglycerol kinase family protein [Candidatus Eremiobacteraeota bacterium]|nr:diacylglycerol kinase family protein [Candidatus Eremiobacteraeota bacterium]